MVDVKILRTIIIVRIVLAVNQTDILAARLRRFEPLKMDSIRTLISRIVVEPYNVNPE